MTQILVPLDGSPLAEQVLPCAITLCRALGSELLLFGAVSIPSDTEEILAKAGVRADALLEELKTEADEHLRKVVNHLRERGLEARHVIQYGPAPESIVGFAEQMDVGQIVMATHGYNGPNRWTHGSVAERVLQSASVPVLLVRAKEEVSKGIPEASPCRRILVPLDGSKMAEQVLPAVAPIARALGCELKLFQVPIANASGSLVNGWYLPFQAGFETADQVAQDCLERLATDLRNQGIETSTATWAGPVAESIIDYAEVSDADLIAMCTHGRTGLARWALGSVADRVLRASDKPILLVRARRTGNIKMTERKIE